MVLLEFSMAPMGKGDSVSPYVARCLEIIAASGLDYELHSMGTILEGEWNDVMGVVSKCFEALKPDCDRISVTMKVDYRKGRAGRLKSKVQSVQALVKKPLRTGGST